METRKPDQMTPSTPDTIAAKKPWQTPRLTCETEANSAQKILTINESFTEPVGPS
jgi:hypothetical protein